MEIEIAAPQLHRSISGGGGGGGADVENGGGAFLTWEDLTAVLPNFGNGPTRRLINGLTGYALPGRLSGNVIMSGDVLLNGKKRKLHYGVVAYVTQEDVFLGTLTVRETITYSALLRLPSNTTKDEIYETIENTITEMGLQECADHVTGNWHLRGISGGEKKRLSIALEIITQPNLLFLDEPTSGLDSASAFFVVQALKNVARSGRTIISSIHQPSSEVFALFDDLLLLSSGETIYFGEAGMAVEFFGAAGFPCPERRNPSDHFLRCVNSDFDDVTNTLMGSQRIRDINRPSGRVTNLATAEIRASSGPLMNIATAEIRARLLHKYQNSKLAAKVKARIKDFSTIGGLVFEETSGSQATWLKQLSTLTKRSSINMSRDFGYYWLRILIFIVVSICVGSVFHDVGSNYHAILARGACGGFISGFMTFMTIGGFSSFIEEMKVFHKERLNGHYGVGVCHVVHIGNWICPKYLRKGAYKNDMIGIEFEGPQPGEPKLKGEVVLTSLIGISLNHSKWWDLAAVAAILISYRLLFFSILKFKERALPIYKTYYTKRTLHHMKQRPSFRKAPPFPSKRHHIVHSLSSQEGLNSPLH
ncbi:hypothetical protein DH2020_046515 [Rehmannia glutinosa]|uniref:ABC transporter domain-containing protein n=1 Tax=Rehmannia glutinosa TaxID=99300 RepID=A0ABR0UC08_REHGL